MTSMLSRVQRGTVLAAGVAAALTACATSAIASWLVQRAEDRRLRDVAVLLAEEINAEEHDSVHATVEDEMRETSHMGLLFAVFDARARVAGDERLEFVSSDQCVTRQGLRACAVTTKPGLTVVAAGSHASLSGWFLMAAFVSVVLAAFAAQVASRPLARALVAPLTRLRDRLAEIDDSRSDDLGAKENVEEIDRLRDALAALLRRLRAALEQSERFSANAAHELRTPLTAVRAQLELLDEEPDKTTSTLAFVRQTTSRLEVLVERLLVLATPTGSPEPALETLSLRDALEDVSATLQGHERVTLEFVDDVIVKADAALVHAMLSNALGNALRFGTKVRATLSSAKGLARIVVEDDGPGVPEAEKERVFEPFQRLRPGGHGLGLALIAHVARRYGGAARFLPSSAGARLELTLRSAS